MESKFKDTMKAIAIGLAAALLGLGIFYLGCFSSKEGAKETEKLTSVNAVLIDGGDIIIQPATIDGHKYVVAYSKQFQNLSICPVRGE
jgi:hypothetical protein